MAGKTKPPTFVFLIARNPRRRSFWRWMHISGKEIGRSSETYSRPADCVRGLQRALRGVSVCDYEIQRETPAESEETVRVLKTDASYSFETSPRFAGKTRRHHR